jgi:hypothetical protein
LTPLRRATFALCKSVYMLGAQGLHGIGCDGVSHSSAGLGFKVTYEGCLFAIGRRSLGEGKRDVVELGEAPEIELCLLLLGAADECLCPHRFPRGLGLMFRVQGLQVEGSRRGSTVLFCSCSATQSVQGGGIYAWMPPPLVRERCLSPHHSGQSGKVEPLTHSSAQRPPSWPGACAVPSRG